MIAYPEEAKELIRLLKQDQEEWRNFAQTEFEAKIKSTLKVKREILRQKVHQRARRMLQILNEIGEPSLSNIGIEAAQAISILALHDSINTLQIVLGAFVSCFEHQRENTYYQALPSMTDWLLLLEHKPQRFGTIWLFDKNNKPFLPTVEDFEHVNKRRSEYGIEPLRWPKSLAIPESKQPWLKQPLTELVMREPTKQDYNDFARDYVY